MDIDNNNDNDDEVADTTSAQIASLAPVSLRQLNESEFGSFSGEIIASSQEGKIIIENEDQANSKESGFSKQSEISLDDIQFPSDLSKDYHPLVNDNDYYYLTNNEEDESQIISEEEGASSTHQSKKQKIKQKVDNLFSNTQTTPLNVSHDDFRVAVFKAGHNLLKNQFTLSTAQELNTMVNELSPSSFGEHMDHLAHHLITILRELLKLPINQEKKNDLFALGMDWIIGVCGYVFAVKETNDVHVAYHVGDLILLASLSSFEDFLKTLDTLFSFRNHQLRLKRIIEPAYNKQSASNTSKSFKSVTPPPNKQSTPPNTFFTPVKKQYND